MAKAAFEAFEPSVVVDEFARKIDSLCVWRDTLIAGLSDGSLLFFHEQSAEGSTGASISTWQVTRVQKNFCKRGIFQLRTLENEQHLLSLSDDGVQLHSLPELQLTSAASRTSRAGAFSWDDSRRLLVTAIKRKVVSHQLDTNNMFIEMTEYNIPEPVIALSWAGSSIVLATAKSYWLIVPAASQSVEVLPGQVMTIYPAVQPQLLFAAGANSLPVMTRLPSGEVLITKDAVSYFLGSDGKPSRKTTITWSQPPTALMATKLYVVAVLPTAVEVKSVSRLGAAAAEQMLLLQGMAVTAPSPAPDGSLYLASATDGGIRQLKPVPLERQAKLLAAAGDFQGALELLTLLEDEESTTAAATAGDGPAAGGSSAASRRQQLEDVLRLRFGYHLFEAGEPDEALTQLSMCSDPDPLLLLKLYPSLVPDKFKPLLPSSAYGESLPEITHHSGRSSADVDGNSTGPGGPSSVSAAVSRSESRKRNGSSAADDAAALAVVVPYLLSHRTRMLSQLEDAAAAGSSGGDNRVQDPQQNGHQPLHHSSSESSISASSPTANGSSSRSRFKSQEQLQLIAAVIDTAILRAMLMQSDSGALLRLLQQVNFVDVEDGESVLSAAGRYAELAALYQYNRRHSQGLELLQQLSQHAGSLQVPPKGAAADLKGLPGVWAAVRYLTAMQPQDIKLIKEHAGWILECDPEAGLEALLAMNPPLSTQLVKPLLEAHAPHFTAVYLESALDLGLATPREVHSELLLIYLHMALEEEREGEKSSEAHALQLSLSDLLVSRPHQPLKLFPDDPSLWGAPRTSQAGAPPSGTSGDIPVPQEGTSGDTGAVEQGVAGDAAGDAAAAPAALQQPSRTVSPAPTAAVQLHKPTRRDAYQRLRELVYSSDFIDPEYVLSKLGQGQLLEIRALMLERLGRHREALSVYIHDLKAIDLAEQYCDRVYEAGIAAITGRSLNVAPGVTPGGSEGTSGDTATGAGDTAAAEGSSGPATAEPAKQLGSGPRVHGVHHSTGTGTRRGLAGTSVAAGSAWGKVQKQQQKGKQRPRERQQQPAGRRLWPALPFGVLPQDIYMELVDAVLQGPGKAGGSADGAVRRAQQRQQAASAAAAVDHEAWKQLSQLLSRKTDRINHLQVLDVLPDQLPLSDVSALLSSMLVYDTEQKRNLSVVHHLRRAENLMAREDLVKVQQRVVTLTFERACCICHKRMGGAVSVAYPNGTLAHYLCYKRSTGQQQGQPLWDSTPAAAGGAAPAGDGAVTASSQQQPGVGTEAWLRQSLAGQQPQQRSNEGGWGSMVSAVAH